MEMKTLRTKKLVDVVNVDDIHSVTVISRGRGSRSICIALRTDVSLPEWGIYEGVGWIKLNRLSYTFISGVAIPKDFYKHISLSVARGNGPSVVFAKINKHIPFGSRREAIWQLNHSSNWEDIDTDVYCV